MNMTASPSPIQEQYTGHRYEFRSLGGGRICCSADHVRDLCEECQQKAAVQMVQAAASTLPPALVTASASAAKALRATAAKIAAEGRDGTLHTAAEWDLNFAEVLGFNAIFDRVELPAPDGYAEALTAAAKPVGYRQGEDHTFDNFGGNPPDGYAIALTAARGTE